MVSDKKVITGCLSNSGQLVLFSFRNSRCACDGGVGELLMKLNKSLSFATDVDSSAAIAVAEVSVLAQLLRACSNS